MQIDLDELLAAGAGPAFYVVSRRKLAILFLSTFSGYAIYWFYKNWSCYKGKHPEASRLGSMVSPAPRAAFSMFFTHALFHKVKAHGKAQPAVARWRADLHATTLIVLMLLANFIDVLIAGPAGDVASFAGIVVLVLPFLTAQRMINLSCSDPEGKSNDRLTKANWGWMFVGAISWVFVIFGLSK
jgi:hypothetical protein